MVFDLDWLPSIKDHPDLEPADQRKCGDFFSPNVITENASMVGADGAPVSSHSQEDVVDVDVEEKICRLRYGLDFICDIYLLI